MYIALDSGTESDVSYAKGSSPAFRLRFGDVGKIDVVPKWVKMGDYMDRKSLPYKKEQDVLKCTYKGKQDVRCGRQVSFCWEESLGSLELSNAQDFGCIDANNTIRITEYTIIYIVLFVCLFLTEIRWFYIKSL